jgi:citrate lyase subunit gamma (acyl carrier protein)
LKTVLKKAQAGSLESNDIMIIMEPGSGGIAVDLESIVMGQFGRAITDTIVSTVRQHGVDDLRVKAIDKGALDCTIRARTATALMRAGVPPKGEAT